MKLPSPVPRAPGAKVLIVVFLALAGQQANGDKQLSDDEWLFKYSSSRLRSKIKDLPSELQPKMRASNDADKELLRDLVNNRDTSASKAAFDKAMKEEQDLFKKLVNAQTGYAYRELYSKYVSVRTGQIHDYASKDPEFKSFFSTPSDSLETYKAIKKQQLEDVSDIRDKALKIEYVPGPGEPPKRSSKERTRKRPPSAKESDDEKLESEFKDMKKRRNSLEERLEKRSNLLKRQEKGARKRGRKVFELEEKMEDEDFKEKFVEDRQDMDIVDRMERNIDKGSAETNHRKANPDKGDSRSSSSSSSGGARGAFWFSIVVGIIAEAVVIIVVLLVYRNDISRTRQMRRSTREAEPLNSYRGYSSKISSGTTLPRSMMH